MSAQDIRQEPVEGLSGQGVLPDLVSMFGCDTIELKMEHEIFVRRLIAMGNATEAYLQAYPNVSRTVARRAASRLLTNDDIRKRYQQIKSEIAAKEQYTAEDAYRDLVNIIRCDRRRLYDADGNLKGIHEMDEDVVSLIDGIEETKITAGVKKVKVLLPKRLDAIDKVMRFHGAYKDRTELSGPGGSPLFSLLDEVIDTSRELVSPGGLDNDESGG